MLRYVTPLPLCSAVLTHRAYNVRVGPQLHSKKWVRGCQAGIHIATCIFMLNSVDCSSQCTFHQVKGPMTFFTPEGPHLYLCSWVLHFEQFQDGCPVIGHGNVSNVIHQHLQGPDSYVALLATSFRDGLAHLHCILCPSSCFPQRNHLHNLALSMRTASCFHAKPFCIATKAVIVEPLTGEGEPSFQERSFLHRIDITSVLPCRDIPRAQSRCEAEAM